MTHRGIAECSRRGRGADGGRDHSLYAEPPSRDTDRAFRDIFRRRGRRHGFVASRNEYGGELIYDSLGIRWNEYVPLGNSQWVATLRGWAAEDDKENGIRRPDDLSLGGTDFLRGYEGSVRYGDSLRAAAVHIGRPIPVEIPWIQSWVHKELVIAEAFWEMGDVRNTGRDTICSTTASRQGQGYVRLFRSRSDRSRWPHDGGENIRMPPTSPFDGFSRTFFVFTAGASFIISFIISISDIPISGSRYRGPHNGCRLRDTCIVADHRLLSPVLSIGACLAYLRKCRGPKTPHLAISSCC